jgi:steroid delta-isomerase-like uncharacterized protein
MLIRISERTRKMSTAATPTAPDRAAEMAELFDRYGDAWASHDPDAIAAFHAPDGVFHLHAGADLVRGRAAIRDTFAGFIAQWPDLAFQPEQVDFADWGWVVRWTMRGTLAQPLEVEGATASPGGRIEVDALDVITVDDDGLLAAKHTYLDALELVRQTGAAA